MADYTPPTPDEIHRVAEYWERVKMLSCKHTNGMLFNDPGVGPICSDCHQSLRFLTDIQLEEHRRQRLDTDLRDRLVEQLERGGARFAINGEWYEVRLNAHYFPDGTESDDMVGCLPVEDVQLLLRATESS